MLLFDVIHFQMLGHSWVRLIFNQPWVISTFFFIFHYSALHFDIRLFFIYHSNANMERLLLLGTTFVDQTQFPLPASMSASDCN
jgi:hypothetical protein